MRNDRWGQSTFHISHSTLGRGFTFVELLVAATMISVLFVGLGTHLRGGLIVWQRATSSGEALQQERVAFDRLERDLANAIVFDNRKSAYGDGRGQLPRPRFRDSELAFFTVSAARRRQPPTVQFVTYDCKELDGTLGLWRTSQSVGAARAQSPALETERLLPDCKDLSFQYAYLPGDGKERQELMWNTTWPDDREEPLRLPRLVNVSLHVAGRATRNLCAVPSGDFGRAEETH